MRFYKKIKLDLFKNTLYSIIISGVFFNISWAQQEILLENPIQARSFEALIETIARYLSVIGLPLAAIFIIISGFMFLTAMGDVEKLKTAKKMLLWAIIGTVIIVGAWVFARAAVNFAKSL